MRSTRLRMLPVLLLLAAGGADRPRDEVDVLLVGERLLAVSARGDRQIAVQLQLRERVLHLASKGAVGVAVTTRRLLAVNADSLRWQELRLRLQEHELPPGAADLLVGDRIVLIVLPARAVGFSSATGSWSELTLGPAERVDQRILDEDVAALVTNRRAIGFAARGGFATTPLQVGEGRPRPSTQDRSVTLVTERRVLIFTDGSSWRSFARNLRF